MPVFIICLPYLWLFFRLYTFVLDSHGIPRTPTPLAPLLNLISFSNTLFFALIGGGTVGVLPDDFPFLCVFIFVAVFYYPCIGSDACGPIFFAICCIISASIMFNLPVKWLSN